MALDMTLIVKDRETGRMTEQISVRDLTSYELELIAKLGMDLGL